MINRLLFLSLLGCLIFHPTQSVLAQEVLICKRFSNTGDPKEVMSEITVDSLPIKLKVLYNNGKTTIDRSKLNMLIEYEDSKNLPAEPFYLNVSQSRNWVGSDIEFKHDGHHVISAFTPENRILASCNFTVILKGKTKSVVVKKEETVKKEVAKKPVVTKTVVKADVVEKKEVKEPIKKEEKKLKETGFDPNTKVEITEEEAETLHYNDVKLEFGTGKTDNGLAGKGNSFSLSNGRADVSGMLVNQLPIKTKTIQVDIWQKGKDGSFSELTVSEEYESNPKSYRSFFPLRFYRSGEYKISIYNDDFVWISSGYLTIN